MLRKTEEQNLLQGPGTHHKGRAQCLVGRKEQSVWGMNCSLLQFLSLRAGTGYSSGLRAYCNKAHPSPHLSTREQCFSRKASHCKLHVLFYYFSIVMIRCHDQGNLTEETLFWVYGFRELVHDGRAEVASSGDWSSSWELTFWSPSRRQGELTQNGSSCLKPQSLPEVTHLFPQGHTF